MEINDKLKEALIITQEECAEVIQSISKVMRFGFESRYPTDESESTKDSLEAEVGQLLCMIDILISRNIIDGGRVYDAREKKKEKLKIWSNLYK
jgi:NTP pyrophosphatase (non-canonical NTP hydrolase)